MKTRFGGVDKRLVRIDSSNIRFGLAFVTPSAGLIEPGIRHIELTFEVVMYSLQRYPISGMVGTVSFMRFVQSESESVYPTTGI